MANLIYMKPCQSESLLSIKTTFLPQQKKFFFGRSVILLFPPTIGYAMLPINGRKISRRKKLSSMAKIFKISNLFC